IAVSSPTLNGRPAVQYTDNQPTGFVVPASVAMANLWSAGGFLTFVGNVTSNASSGDRIYDHATIPNLMRFQVGSTFLLLQIAASVTNGSWNTGAGIGFGAHQFDTAYSSASVANLPTFTRDGVQMTPSGIVQPVGTITDDSSNNWFIGTSGGANGFPGEMG